MKKKKTSKGKVIGKSENNTVEKINKKNDHKKVKRKTKKEEKREENINIINSNLKSLIDEKKRKRIEDVLKRKKLDILKKKLNEYTKEKLLEKYNEIKEKEKLERKDRKKYFLENLEINRIKPLPNNDDDLLSVNESEKDDKSFISENESVKTSESLSDSENLYNIDSKSDDDKSSEFTSEMSSIISLTIEVPKSNKKESPMIKKLFQKHIEENTNNNKPYNIKDPKDKPNQNEKNKYLKMDETLAQAYIHFCKKVKIPYNDFYSQFIADNINKEKINEYLNIKTSNKKVVNKGYGNDNIKSNKNEVLVDAGTSGFRKRNIFFM